MLKTTAMPASSRSVFWERADKQQLKKEERRKKQLIRILKLVHNSAELGCVLDSVDLWSFCSTHDCGLGAFRMPRFIDLKRLHAGMS